MSFCFPLVFLGAASVFPSSLLVQVIWRHCIEDIFSFFAYYFSNCMYVSIKVFMMFHQLMRSVLFTYFLSSFITKIIINAYVPCNIQSIWDCRTYLRKSAYVAFPISSSEKCTALDATLASFTLLYSRNLNVE
jgi:hypothetical protein